MYALKTLSNCEEIQERQYFVLVDYLQKVIEPQAVHANLLSDVLGPAGIASEGVHES